MMKRLFLLVLVAFAWSGLAFGQTNLLTNGGLEDWDTDTKPTGWTKAESVEKESVIVKVGSFAAKQSAGTKDLQQVISGITAGHSYIISFWYLDNDPNAKCRIWSSWLSGTTTNNDNAAELRPGTYSSDDANWVKYEKTITAPAGVDGFRFEVRTYKDGDGTGVIYFDGFSVIDNNAAAPGIPTISNVSITPAAPIAGNDVAVSADAKDSDGTIASVGLTWFVGDSITASMNSVAMNNGGSGDTYTCFISGATLVVGDSVNYQIKAKDDLDNSSPVHKGYFIVKALPTEVSNIAALRAGTIGTEYKLTGEAILTFQQTNRNQKYIQDVSGAILIDDNAGTISTTYNLYDGITGIVGTLSEHKGMLQFIPTANPATASSTGNTITPEDVTIANLNANLNNYESELVIIKGAEITEADGTATFANGTNYTLKVGTDEIVFRTNFKDVDYIGQVIPQGKIDLTALVMEYNGTPQVCARNLADIAAVATPAGETSITNIAINPTAPTKDDAVSVSATVTDDDGIDKVELLWGIATGSLTNTVTMTASGDIYSGTIPAQAAETPVFYIIKATDSGSNEKNSTERSYTVKADTPTPTPGAGFASEDFEGGAFPAGWLTVTPTYATHDFKWHINDHSGNHTLRASCYKENQNHVTEQWVITPAFSTQGSTDVKLTFDNDQNYNPYQDLEVYVSTDFAGDSANFDVATWTKLTVSQLSGGNWEVVNSSASLNNYLGQDKVYVAFKYVSTDAAGGVWDIDNVKILKDGITPGTAEMNISKFELTPKLPTAADEVSVSAQVLDTDGIKTVTLLWGTATGTLTNTVAMSNGGSGDVYTTGTKIPAQEAGTTVYYTVTGVDNNDVSVTSTEQSYTVKAAPGEETLSSEDFQDGSLPGGWLTVTPTYAAYKAKWKVKENKGNYYLRASCHDGTNNHATEQWIVAPVFSTQGNADVKLVFDNEKNYAPLQDLEVYVSTDFAGDSASFGSATWTKISVTGLATEDGWNWVEATASLNDYLNNDKVYVAFKYVSTDAAGGVWDIDNVKIVKDGNDSSGVLDVATQNLSVYPNPVCNVLNINGAENTVKIQIVNLSGQVVKEIFNTSANLQINMEDLQNGVYVLVFTKKDGKPFTRNIIKQ